MVTHQLQVERRTGKLRQSETDVLPLCYSTNLTERSLLILFAGYLPISCHANLVPAQCNIETARIAKCYSETAVCELAEVRVTETSAYAVAIRSEVQRLLAGCDKH